jgi:hypothetical protein
MTVQLLTFADDTCRPTQRLKQPSYLDTQTKMVNFFRERFPDITSYHIYKHEDMINSDFYKENPNDIFSPKHIVMKDKNRTIGRYLYCQAYLIYKTLNDIADGEFLLWHDANPTVMDKYFSDRSGKMYSLEKHMQKCIKNKGTLVWIKNNRPPIKTTASPELLADLNANHLKNTITTCSSWIMVQKTPHSLNLWKKIYTYSTTKLPECRNCDYQDNMQEIIDLMLKLENMTNFAVGQDKTILDSFPNP